MVIKEFVIDISSVKFLFIFEEGDGDLELFLFVIFFLCGDMVILGIVDSLVLWNDEGFECIMRLDDRGLFLFDMCCFGMDVVFL